MAPPMLIATLSDAVRHPGMLQERVVGLIRMRPLLALLALVVLEALRRQVVGQ